MEKTDLPGAMFGAGPRIDPTAFVAAGARIVGDVRLGVGSSVWYNAVLRGDINHVEVGANSNIQDGSILHVENDRPCVVRERVTVGHRAILHACTIEPECLIGMGAIILSGAFIGRGSIIAAGAVIRENTTVEPYSLMAGVPGRLVRKLDRSRGEENRRWALKYTALAEAHRARGFSAEPPDSANG